MHLYQSEIRARLRHGLSQTELAQQLGVSVGLLNNVLNGIREPGPKVLKALGIRVHKSYVLIEDDSIPEGIAARAPAKHQTRPKRASLPKLQRAPAVHVSPSLQRPPLDATRVKIAMRFKLNPANAWSAFCASSNPANWIDVSAYERYCEASGIAPTQKPIEQETLGKPGELYAHLKPVNRGIDHRRPKAFGEQPDIVQYAQPEAL